MRGMLRILRRLEMVSRVDPIAWNSYSRSEDQQTHDTGANLVAHSGTHPGHYAPPVAPQWLAPVGQTVYSKGIAKDRRFAGCRKVTPLVIFSVNGDVAARDCCDAPASSRVSSLSIPRLWVLPNSEHNATGWIAPPLNDDLLAVDLPFYSATIRPWIQYIQ